MFQLSAGVKLPVVSQILVKLHWLTPSEEAVWWSVAEDVTLELVFQFNTASALVHIFKSGNKAQEKHEFKHGKNFFFFNYVSWK